MRNEFNPLVLIPSYNPGSKGIETVMAALNVFQPILVVTDGSTDGSDHAIESEIPAKPGLHLIRSAQNEGKGAAVLKGLVWAKQRAIPMY